MELTRENIAKLRTSEPYSVLRTMEQFDNVPKIILSGSFSPLHDGHVKILRYIHENLKTISEFGSARFRMELRKNSPVIVLEKTVNNLDKVCDEAKDHKDMMQIAEYGIPLYVTNAGTFVAKSCVLQHSIFAIGFDTFNRLIDKRCYANSYNLMFECFDRIKDNGCRFIIFERAGVELDENKGDLISQIDQDNMLNFIEGFEPVDISSTEIRNENDRKD